MPEPVVIDIPNTEVRDLKRHLAHTRWPSEVTDSGWPGAFYETRSGSSSPLRDSKKADPSGISRSPGRSTPDRPETIKSDIRPISRRTVIAP